MRLSPTQRAALRKFIAFHRTSELKLKQKIATLKDQSVGANALVRTLRKKQIIPHADLELVVRLKREHKTAIVQKIEETETEALEHRKARETMLRIRKAIRKQK